MALQTIFCDPGTNKEMKPIYVKVINYNKDYFSEYFLDSSKYLDNIRIYTLGGITWWSRLCQYLLQVIF